MRERYDERLNLLNENLVKMSEMVKEQIKLTVLAIKNQNKEIAKEILKNEPDINAMEKTIERMSLNLIMHQQPVAKDLRLITAAFKMIIDLERIGDHAVDISEILLETKENLRNIEKFTYFLSMADITSQMITDSIKSYITKDLNLAYEVIKNDDKVDELFEKIKKEMMHLIKETDENGEKIIEDILVAKYFERIGDHSVNIAEWTIFSITGEHKNSRIL